MTEMAAKIVLKPREAAIEIAEAYEKNGGHAQKVAAFFAIEYRTLLRWVAKLGSETVRKGATLQDVIDRSRERAKKSKAA